MVIYLQRVAKSFVAIFNNQFKATQRKIKISRRKERTVIALNKYQRAKIRINRDKIRKVESNRIKYQHYDNFDDVMHFQNYIEALHKCRVGVSWKGSVQLYTQNAITEISKSIESLLNNKLPKLSSVKRITLYERGKKRNIVPITIKDRMIQRVLCDYSLIPVLKDKLIYDNGASMKDKGVDFTRKRVEKHLREAIKEYGSDFYALTFDFKSFFNSIPHSTCLKILKENFTDKRIIGLVMAIIKSYQEIEIKNTISDLDERNKQLKLLKENKLSGICLGSQISQIMALVVPNMLDHYIKDSCGAKHYIRYMDDGIILSNDKEFLHNLYKGMIEISNILGLKFNNKKTHITKITKGVMFMKIKYIVTPQNTLIKKLSKPGIVRMRRKLKKFKNLVKNGAMTLDDVYNSIQSWIAHSYLAKAYFARRNMIRLYNSLFSGYKLTKKYKHIKGGCTSELLQIDKWQKFRWSCNPT